MITYKKPDHREPIVRLEAYIAEWQRGAKAYAKHVRQIGSKDSRIADAQVRMLTDVLEQIRAVRDGKA